MEKSNASLKGALPDNYFSRLGLDGSKLSALIAEMIEPYKGKIYDPCCGSGGMFVQSLKFVQSHHGNVLCAVERGATGYNF